VCKIDRLRYIKYAAWYSLEIIRRAFAEMAREATGISLLLIKQNGRSVKLTNLSAA